MKTIRYLALLSLLFLGFTAQAQILVVGDSLSSGHGIDPDDSWVSILSKKASLCRPPVEIINASVSGETTTGGLARLPTLLKEYHPEVVMIALGGNDALRGKDLPGIEENLTQMIKLAKAEGAQVMLIGMQAPSTRGLFYSWKFKRIYKRIAKNEKVTFIPFFVDNLSDAKDKTLSDGLHPNTQGHREMYHHVWPYVREDIGC